MTEVLVLWAIGIEAGDDKADEGTIDGRALPCQSSS